MGEQSAERRPWSLPLAVKVAEALVVGERPTTRRRSRPQRAARAGARTVRVEAGRLVWRSRVRREGELLIADIARVALVEAEYLTSQGPTPVALYALVIDHDGAVRLRIGAAGNRTALGAPGKRLLSQMWEPLGIPVTRETTVMGHVKDYRRRWPEAFSFAHAYPLVTAAMAFAAWMVVVVPALDRLLGL